MAEWIVKLIPFGNPEDHLSVIKTVGGEPGFGDFVGWHLEQFSFTTDVAGQAVVVLNHPAASHTSCYCITTDDQRIIRPLGLASSINLTVQKYKLAYDKPATPISSPSNAPTGVTVAATSGQEAATFNGGGSGDALRNAVLYDHKHTLSFTQTVIPIAASESTHLLVLYK